MKDKEVILIVGEDDDYVAALSDSIDQFGYESIVAGSSTEGIQLAFEHSPDLIIYHTKPNCFKSFDFFNIVKESRLTFDIPFVIISEGVEFEEVQFALEMGVDGVFDKPLKLADLQRIIDARIKKYLRLKRESERDFLRSFDITSSAAAIFNSDFKIVNGSAAFFRMFSIDHSLPIWENLGFDEDTFLKLSYKVFAGHEGQESFEHTMEVDGELETFSVVVSNLNTIFAKRCALLVLNRADSAANSYASMHVADRKRAGRAGITATAKEGELVRQSPLRTRNELNLTKRQLEVLELSIMGLPMKLIADRLCISEKTVEKYRASLMEKTGAKNIIELVIFAIKNKYVNV